MSGKLILASAALILSALAFPVFAADGVNMPALLLDIVLIGGVVAIYLGAVFAGELRSAFNYAFVGIFIFAVNHLIETMMFAFGFGADVTEIIHRLIHLAGFAFLIYGFYRVRKVISSVRRR